MKKLRVMVLMDQDLVPPESMDGYSEEQILEWKMEFDVLTTLREMGHIPFPLGVSDELHPIRQAILEHQPHVVFNLLEEFLGVAVYDAHVVSFLELLRQPYTGCNPRGLMLAHDKALCKKILTFHRIPTPHFTVYPLGRKVGPVPSRLKFPLLVKSVVEEASLGITHDSIVYEPDELQPRIEQLHEEVATDALVEEYIEGREFYVGMLGNQRLQCFPVWELLFTQLPPDMPNIATADAKWNSQFQEQVGMTTAAAGDLTDQQQAHIEKLCKRVYRSLNLSGYARIDLRMSDEGRVYVLEANPNPNLSYGEDFAESAEAVGISYEGLIQRVMNLGRIYRSAWRN